MSHTKFRHYTQLDEICNDLMGQSIEECEDDNSGTWFDNDHWVSGDLIAEALVEAYNKGKIEGEAQCHV